jgi:hypothetical protein
VGEKAPRRHCCVVPFYATPEHDRGASLAQIVRARSSKMESRWALGVSVAMS